MAFPAGRSSTIVRRPAASGDRRRRNARELWSARLPAANHLDSGLPRPQASLDPHACGAPVPRHPGRAPPTALQAPGRAPHLRRSHLRRRPRSPLAGEERGLGSPGAQRPSAALRCDCFPPHALSRCEASASKSARRAAQSKWFGGTAKRGERDSRLSLIADAPRPPPSDLKGAGGIPWSPRSGRSPFSDPKSHAARPRASPALQLLPPASRTGFEGAEALGPGDPSPRDPHVHSP